MKKLYAIRNKETGELYRVAGKPAVFTKPDAPTKHLVNESRELVTLRIEPTEPCTWCKPASWKVFDERMKFCDQCGRSLT